MGKIRVKTLGDSEQEEKQAKAAEKRQAAKKAKKAEEAVETSEVKNEEVATEAPVEISVEEKQEKTEKKVKKQTPENTPSQSKRFQEVSMKVDRSKNYSLAEGVTLLKQVSTTKFDSSVELHINTSQKGISGQVSLPHGTGKQVRVVVATPESVEEIIKNVEANKIEFDVLLATPAVMPKLAKIARILGPKGMMPNPKNGTITDKPEEVAKKFEGGQVNFKTEAQVPVIHTTVGKVSFSEKAIEENIQEFVRAVGTRNIVNVTLKSTMSPGIRLNIQSL